MTHKVLQAPMQEGDIGSGWWLNHAIVVFGVPLAFLVALLGSLLNSNLIFVLYFSLALLVLAAALGSLIGYHKEANILRDLEADWIPHKWLYTLAHIFTFGWGIALIYLIQRWRHIGIPWRNLPLVPR